MKKVIVLAPFLSGDMRGNAVHAERKAALLRAAGIQVVLLDASLGLDGAVDLAGAEALIALHAWRTADVVATILQRVNLPLVIVTTGTDVPPGLDDDKRAVAAAIYARAMRIAVQHAAQIDELEAAFPTLGIHAKARLVPPSVNLDLPSQPLRPTPGAPSLLHISGIRPIKGVGFIPEFMDGLWKRRPEVCYTLLGEALESAYAAPVLAWIEARPNATRRAGLSHPESLALLRESTLLISTSRHEGLSNALLEAMAGGTPVVATNIAPNRALIRDGQDGLLYDGKGGFVAAVEKLLDDPALAARLAASARQRVAREHNAAKEQGALVELLAEVAAQT